MNLKEDVDTSSCLESKNDGITTPFTMRNWFCENFTTLQLSVYCNWCAIMLNLFHGNVRHLKLKCHSKTHKFYDSCILVPRWTPIQF